MQMFPYVWTEWGLPGGILRPGCGGPDLIWICDNNYEEHMAPNRRLDFEILVNGPGGEHIPMFAFVPDKGS